MKREHGITLGWQPGVDGKGGRHPMAKAEFADHVLVHRNTKLTVIEANVVSSPMTLRR